MLQSLPVELFVAEVNPERLAQARTMGISETYLFKNYHEISACMDAMVMETPVDIPFELCREFLEAGKDVFIEKPILILVLEHSRKRDRAHLLDYGA